MGKNRRGRGGSGSNTTSNSNDVEVVRVLGQDVPIEPRPDESAGGSTTLQQDEDKLQNQLSDLRADLKTAELKKDTLWEKYQNIEWQINRVEEQLSYLQSEQDNSGARKNLEQRLTTLRKDLQSAEYDYLENEREIARTRNEIYNLEFNPSYSENSDWVTNEPREYNLDL